jgi:hypothetical protein
MARHRPKISKVRLNHIEVISLSRPAPSGLRQYTAATVTNPHLRATLQWWALIMDLTAVSDTADLFNQVKPSK